MYRRIGNCDTCGSPFATLPGEVVNCAYCGVALPTPLEEVGLGRVSKHQLLGEAFVRKDWHVLLDILEHILAPEPPTPRTSRYLFFAGTIAGYKLRDHTRALAYFERAAAADPHALSPRAARAEVFARQARYGEAEHELRAAIQRAQAGGAPAKAMRHLWLALGNLLRDHLNDPDQARACFELAERRG